ncbi:MAG: hypothetical protein AAGG75_13760 [Bacteroidota bacterium]
MADKRINVIIKVNPTVEQLSSKERLSTLITQLQNLEIEVIELAQIGHLVIDTDQEKWERAIREIAELTHKDIDIQPNSLI